MRLWHKLAIGTAAGIVLAGAALFALDAADHAFPPPLEKAEAVSPEVLDADGQLLRAFATPEGRWRLKTTVDAVLPLERAAEAHERLEAREVFGKIVLVP